VKRELVGQRFDRLLVVERGELRSRNRHWIARCDCGGMASAPASALIRGRVKSCGCLNAELRVKRNTKHGGAVRGALHPDYNLWQGMIARCEDQKNKAYRYYGGRGIKVCARWRESFAAFLADLGPRPPGHQVDRKDNDGDYEPGNCRWATKEQQERNKRPWGSVCRVASGAS